MPSELGLPSGATLRRRGASWQVERGGVARPADDDEVAAVVAALTRSWPLVARPTDEPPATLRVVADGEEVVLALWPTLARLARADEPVALAIDAAAVAALTVDAVALRDRELWREEADAALAIEVVDGARAPRTFARGAALGEWVDPTGATVSLGPVPTALASPRARRFLGQAPPTRPTRRYAVRFAPPPVAGGAEVRHELALWRTGGGCVAQVDDAETVELEPAACAALLGTLP
ncbi:MAG: hypothetical protein R2939_20925 [Kofleriaceae bacterium]